MPCYGGDPFSKLDTDESDNDAFEALACGIFTVLESRGELDGLLSAIDWRTCGLKQHKVRHWWKRHQEDDRKRCERNKMIKALRRDMEELMIAYRVEQEDLNMLREYFRGQITGKASRNPKRNAQYLAVFRQFGFEEYEIDLQKRYWTARFGDEKTFQADFSNWANRW